MNTEPKPVPINVELGEKESEGVYSNLALITHSPSEFVLDFARILPGVQRAKVYARVVMTPMHAKLLLNALDENIKKFEDQFGKIKLYSGPPAVQGDDKGIGFQLKESTVAKTSSETKVEK